MINALIKAALSNRLITLLLFGLLAIAGFIAMRTAPVDAIPDLSENQVIVMTQWMGQNPRNIEDQITFPLTVSMQGLAGVKDIRAMSQMGLSMVTIIFQDNVDFYFARDRVAERLAMVRQQLPPSVTPILGPDATGLGQVYMYTLESDQRSLTELRSLQDFTVRYALQSVTGVAEVASIGGHMKTYQILLDPLKLAQHKLSITHVMNFVRMGNNNVSGTVVDTGNEEVAIQGIGFYESVNDIENLVLGTKSDGSALTVLDVGSVRIGGMSRRGILADARGEKVGGIVVMRFGENPLKIIDGIKEKIKILETSLPEDVSIVPFYDRTDLIIGAIRTLRSVLTQELIITTVILGLFLWHVGSTLITTIALIMGVLLTFLFMRLFGVPSNIMSLGGIAIAIGTMVDSAIVISENAYRKLLEQGNETLAKRTKAVLEATTEVGRPIVFAIFIIILSFLPIFSLQGMEGKLFSPLAFTNVFAMFGALIAALFLVPLLSTFFLKGTLREDDAIPLVRWLIKHYTPFIQVALQRRKIVYGSTLVLMLIGSIAALQIGSEFMPPLDEGSIMYMPISVPDVSEERIQEMLIASNRIIARFPEVETVVGKAGRADTATDPAPLTMLETFITLKPKKEWRRGLSKEELTKEMSRAIRIENLWNSFTQPIIGRIDMLSTGIRGQVGIKVFGDDPKELEKIAIDIERMLGSVPGAADTVAVRTMGLQYLDIDIREDLLAQYGIPKHTVLQTISAGVGGAFVTSTIEGRERYGVEVKLQQSYRQDIDDIRSLSVSSPNGSTVPISSIADIKLVDGPAVIKSENGVLHAVVQSNVRGTDVGSFVKDAQRYLDDNLQLPEGVHLEWAGQYKNQIRAQKRLMIVVPIVIFIIFLLLYLTYKDLWLVGIVMLMIPLSLVGGILALFIANYNFSVAVWVGFIALFGNAVETGVVIMVYLENAFRKRFGIALMEEETDSSCHTELAEVRQIPITKDGIREAVIEGATLRLRPILMTAFTSIIGLLPMLTSTGIGAEVQKPLAVVVVFGLSTSIFLSLIVLPVLFAQLREQQITT